MTIQRVGSFAAPGELATGNAVARREARETRQGRVELQSVTTDALTALEEAAFAATVAVERAFSLTTVLDEALAVLAEMGNSTPLCHRRTAPHQALPC